MAGTVGWLLTTPVLAVLLALLALFISGPSFCAASAAVVPVPTPEQLEWMDLEVGAMITWNLQTTCSPKGGSVPVTSQQCQASPKLYIPTPEATSEWDPDKLDTDEWARVAASFGAKYIVLVADHMAGFALWGTKVGRDGWVCARRVDGVGRWLRWLGECRSNLTED
jgi:alpha-L-fucosidase